MWLHYCTLIGWEIWQNQHSDFHPSCLLSTVSPERIGWCFWTIRMNEGLPLVHSFYTCTSWLLTADFVGYDLMTGWGALSPTRFAAGLRLGGSKAHNRKPEKAALAQSPRVHRAVDGDVSTPLQHETQRRKLNQFFFVWVCFCRYSELATFIPSQICHEKKKTLQPCDVLLVAQDLSVQTLQHLVLCANCQPCRQQIRKSNQRLPCGCCSVGLPGASWIQIRQVETCLFLDDFLRKILLEYLFLLEFIPTLHCNIET